MRAGSDSSRLRRSVKMLVGRTGDSTVSSTFMAAKADLKYTGLCRN